jgi:hypothetical protein
VAAACRRRRSRRRTCRTRPGLATQTGRQTDRTQPAQVRARGAQCRIKALLKKTNPNPKPKPKSYTQNPKAQPSRHKRPHAPACMPCLKPKAQTLGPQAHPMHRRAAPRSKPYTQTPKPRPSSAPMHWCVEQQHRQPDRRQRDSVSGGRLCHARHALRDALPLPRPDGRAQQLRRHTHHSN